MNIFKEKHIKKQIDSYYKKKFEKKNIINEYKELRSSHSIYKIQDNLRNRVYTVMKKNNIKQDITYSQILGCSLGELRVYIEKQFVFGMMFENYGLWEVDHVKPIDSFDFNNMNDIVQCFNYKNLQPLWLAENRSKSNKIIDK